MYAYVLVGSTICDTYTICKIQENVNITNRTSVARIELSQIERSIFQIERSIYDTQLPLAKYGHTIVTELSKIIEFYLWVRMLILITFYILFGCAYSSIFTPPRMCFPIVFDSSIIIIISSYTVK